LLHSNRDADVLINVLFDAKKAKPASVLAHPLKVGARVCSEAEGHLPRGIEDRVPELSAARGTR